MEYVLFTFIWAEYWYYRGLSVCKIGSWNSLLKEADSSYISIFHLNETSGLLKAPREICSSSNNITSKASPHGCNVFQILNFIRDTLRALRAEAIISSYWEP